MKRFLFISVSLCFAIQFSFGQKKFTNVEKAQELKLKHKKTDVVITESKSEYTFKITEKGIKVNQSDILDLITLTSNVKHPQFVHYNDNIDFRSGHAAYKSGRGSLPSNKICGDYEIDNIFYSDAKVCLYELDILYEASEVRFRAEKIFKDPKYLTRIFFHDIKPTEKREIVFQIDNRIDVELVEMNFDGFEIQKTKEEKEGQYIIRYEVNNLEPMKNEPKSLGHLHHYPHMVVVTKNYTTDKGKQVVLSSVEDLYDWYAGLVKQLNSESVEIKEKAKELSSNASGKEEIIRNIYYWVQENIKYIAFEDGIAGFQPEDAQSVLEKRYGDCKGMANLTKALLVEAGIDARLTWIGTNKIPYNYDLPSLSVDNHMICTVFLDDKFYILDATEKYISLGKNAERIQGKEMLIEDGESFMRKKVPEGTPMDNLIERTENLKIIDQQLVGKGKLVVNGEAKKNILYASTNSQVEERKELFDYLSVADQGNSDEVKVNNIPETDRDLPLKIEYDYTLNNKVSGFENDLYIEFDWEKRYGNLKMKADRFTDFYFGRKVMNKVTKKITLPAGYKVSHLPEGLNSTFKDVIVNVEFKKIGNQIVYTNEFIVASGKIKKEDFEQWNKLISQLSEIYSDQIVLTKN